MGRMKVYEADVFDYATKGRRLVAVVAPNRKEAVLAFNGQEWGGPAYTGNIEILDDEGHPAHAVGAGVVLVQEQAGVWERLGLGRPLTFPGADEALAAVEPILTDLGFEAVSPAVRARQPERRWFRPSDRTLVVLYSPTSGLPARLGVSGDGLWLGVPWGEWDAIPTTVARIEAHRARMAEVDA